jgi:hypothetical protein
VRIRATLQVTHDEHRLRGGADKETRGRARDLDAQVSPFADHEVGAGFILARRLPPQAVEIVTRVGEVLGCAVAANLVFGATIARPNIESLASTSFDLRRGHFERTLRSCASLVKIDHRVRGLPRLSPDRWRM